MAALLGRMARAERERDDATAAVEELRWAARLDPLTGLTGRAEFLDTLGRAAARAPSGASLVLIGLDVDAVTDAHGHAAAQRVLFDVAERLSSALHPFDTVARLDGGEFAVLLHAAADPPAAGDRLRALLRVPVGTGGTEVTLTPWTGAARLDGAGPDALLARARAVRRGDGRRPAGPDARALGAALGGPARGPGAVQAVYQQIVRLDDVPEGHEILDLEALARWTHDGTAVSPAVFVPLAARSGLLPALTDHMLDLATERLAAWSADLGHRRVRVGVNVSPQLLLDPAFPGRVAERMERHGVGPGRLVLEITEDTLLDDLVAARSVVDGLRALGVVLCLDDVGAGYSSLRHLRHLPLDAVKIDKAYIADVDTDPDARRFLAAVLAFVRDLGISAVAEGVERSAQADVLRELGVVHAQGYLFGRPAPPGDIDVRGAIGRGRAPRSDRRH